MRVIEFEIGEDDESCKPKGAIAYSRVINGGNVSFNQSMLEADVAYNAGIKFCCDETGTYDVEYSICASIAIVIFTLRANMPDCTGVRPHDAVREASEAKNTLACLDL